MKWTKRKPPKQRKNRWYWWRLKQGCDHEIVHVFWVVRRKSCNVRFPDGSICTLEEMDGEWSSEPIPEPDEA